MKKKVYLVRHAQSHPSRRLPTAQWPLSQKGTVQATQLTDLLAPLGIEQVFSSPYLRCLQTIRPFTNALGMTIEERHGLREIEIIQTLRDDFYDIWCRSWEDFDYALSGSESNRKAQERFLGAVQSVIDESAHETLGICAHGGVIGLLLNAVDADAGRQQAEALTNPDVIRVIVDGAHWTWDREFQLRGLLALASLHDETPINRE